MPTKPSAMRVAAIVPAFQVAPVIGDVIAALLRSWPDPAGVWVVDDGSTDGTGRIAASAGAKVLSHEHNRGKGAALRTGWARALAEGYEVAVTIDGDGQHPPEEALRMHLRCDDASALVLGVRDLAAAGAPRANQLSNGFSNLVLSAFTGLGLADTQCGLRRYPLAATLALDPREDGYGLEAEILIRAAHRRMRIVQLPVRVLYPPEEERITHFDSVRDPTRIVARVLRTVFDTRWSKA